MSDIEDEVLCRVVGQDEDVGRGEREDELVVAVVEQELQQRPGLLRHPVPALDRHTALLPQQGG